MTATSLAASNNLDVTPEVSGQAAYDGVALFGEIRMTTTTGNLDALIVWSKENYRDWPRHVMARREKVTGKILFGPFGWILEQLEYAPKTIVGKPMPNPAQMRAVEDYLGLDEYLAPVEPTSPSEKGVVEFLTKLIDAKDVDGFCEAINELASM